MTMMSGIGRSMAGFAPVVASTAGYGVFPHALDFAMSTNVGHKVELAMVLTIIASTVIGSAVAALVAWLTSWRWVLVVGAGSMVAVHVYFLIAHGDPEIIQLPFGLPLAGVAITLVLIAVIGARGKKGLGHA